MEYRETYTPAPVTVAGIAIEVDISLSVSVWHLNGAIGGKRPGRSALAGPAIAGSVSATPVTIRITTGDKTVSVSLSECTAGETRSIRSRT